MQGAATILTAADERFARTLWQYLRSVERARLQAAYRWVAYDLGLAPDTRARLERRFAWCTFRRFAFELWPDHLGLAHGTYGWKPVLVAEEVLGSDGLVLWFDCATLFRHGPDSAIAAVRADGLWYLRGQTPLYRHADPRALDAMEVPTEVRHLPECVTGALAFDAANPLVRGIVRDWRDHALRPDIIAPAGATLASHKYDQALLSGVLFKAVMAGAIPLGTEEIDISSTRPVRWMSSRNKVAPGVPFWADAGVRAWYGAYKWLDIGWLRFSRWADRKLGGLRRYLVEEFTVWVTDQKSGRTRRLPSPRFGYLADPFIRATADGIWLFAEEFRCAEDRGRLVVLELDRDLSVKRKADIAVVQPFAAFDCHASFPFLFEDSGRVFMIPETSHRRTVDLYECAVWPVCWRLVRRLLFDIDAADTAAVRHGGRWWILTSVARGGGGRQLEIYSCPDIITDRLEPHPVNASGLDAGAPYGTGRNAGTIAPDDKGGLVRFVQKSARHYGQGGEWRRISVLTRDAFAEVTVPAGADQVADCHHLTSSGQYTACDRRTRTGPWGFVRRLWRVG